MGILTGTERRVLALDIGGVCLGLEPGRTRRFFGLPEEEGFPPDWQAVIDDYNCGTIGSEEFCRQLGRLSGGRFTPRRIQEHWNAFLSREIKVTTALLDCLWKRGWQIVFFSDTQPWHDDYLCTFLLPYADKVRDRIYSFRVGAQKPSPLMYQAFEANYGRPGLYLDDRLCNIQGGLAFGWKALQYTQELGERLLAELQR